MCTLNCVSCVPSTKDCANERMAQSIDIRKKKKPSESADASGAGLSQRHPSSVVQPYLHSSSILYMLAHTNDRQQAASCLHRLSHNNINETKTHSKETTKTQHKLLFSAHTRG